jgi:hypothetical protein
VAGIDFTVRTKTAVPLYDAQASIYLGQGLVSPAYVNAAPGGQLFFALRMAPATVTPQRAMLLGVDNNLAFQLYQYNIGDVPLALWFRGSAATPVGPRHLVLSLADDLFVLPSAVTVVQKQPPSVAGVQPQGDGTVTITGSNLNLASSVYFDGLPAAVRVPFSGSDQSGSVTVVPPNGFYGQTATVTVYNADGQTSMLLASAPRLTYTYINAFTPQVTLSSSSLPANASALIDITGVGTNFADGQVTVGFGSPDIFVRNLWVLSATHLIANVSVSKTAALGATEVSVISGFQSFVQPFAFNLQPENTRAPIVQLPVNNIASNQATLYAGASAAISGVNLLQVGSTPTVTLTDANNQVFTAQILRTVTNEIDIAIPLNIAPGVAILRVNNGTDSAMPVALQIDAAPPTISSVTNFNGTVLDGNHGASSGDILLVNLTGVDSNVVTSPSRLRVTMAGIDLRILTVQLKDAFVQVQAALPQSFGGQTVPLMVSLDGTLSAAYAIAVQ